MNSDPKVNRCNDRGRGAGFVSAFLCIFLVLLSAAVLSTAFSLKHRYFTPKIAIEGVAEKVVESDYAVWFIPISATGEDFDLVRNKVESDVAKIIAYLMKYGVAEKEIEQDVMRVFDKLAQKYYSEHNQAQRFSIDHQLIVKTENVHAVKRASLGMNELLKEGVVLAYDGYNSSSHAPRYLFTKMSEIEAEMLSKAVAAARRAADAVFASEGGDGGENKRGALGGVTQVEFNVRARDSDTQGEQKTTIGMIQYCEQCCIEKVVKMVAKVEFHVE